MPLHYSLQKMFVFVMLWLVVAVLSAQIHTVHSKRELVIIKIEHRATGSRRLMSALTFLLTFASPSNGVIRICKDDVTELQYYCNKDAINGILLQ